MPRLYHLPLSPFCRKVRLALAEKGLEVELVTEKVWERNPEFLALNPAGQAPVLDMGGDGPVLAESSAILEWLDEAGEGPPLMPEGADARAEVRRLQAWFDLKFHNEVTVNLLYEKIYRRFMGIGAPSSSAMRAGRENILTHLDYISWLVERRNWLAGEDLTIADLAAAAHLSCIDYLGDAPWDYAEPARIWYARIKSRPSFRTLLEDRVPGVRPAAHYADLDF